MRQFSENNKNNYHILNVNHLYEISLTVPYGSNLLLYRCLTVAVLNRVVSVVSDVQ